MNLGLRLAIAETSKSAGKSRSVNAGMPRDQVAPWLCQRLGYRATLALRDALSRTLSTRAAKPPQLSNWYRYLVVFNPG
jgi:hypothetical protein